MTSFIFSSENKNIKMKSRNNRNDKSNINTIIPIYKLIIRKLPSRDFTIENIQEIITTITTQIELQQLTGYCLLLHFN